MCLLRKTRLRLENATFTNIIKTHVPKNSLNENEWLTDEHRPDKNFNDQQIKAGDWLEKIEGVNVLPKSNSSFTMTLYFEDGTKDTYRLNQGHAYPPHKTLLDFQVWNNHHDLRAWRQGDTIFVRVENTKEQKENHLAEKKNEEAELLIEKKKHEEAPNILEEALELANQEAAKKKIKTNIAKIYHLLGEKLMHKGDDLQIRGEVKEALKVYEKAKIYFEKAIKMKSTDKYVNSEKEVILKLEGNQLIYEATKIEDNAFYLFEKANNPDDFTEVHNKYKEALAKYEEALKKLKEGIKIDPAKFGAALNILKVEIQTVNEAIPDINKVALKYHVQELKEDTEKRQEESDEEWD